MKFGISSGSERERGVTLSHHEPKQLSLNLPNHQTRCFGKDVQLCPLERWPAAWNGRGDRRLCSCSGPGRRRYCLYGAGLRTKGSSTPAQDEAESSAGGLSPGEVMICFSFLPPSLEASRPSKRSMSPITLSLTGSGWQLSSPTGERACVCAHVCEHACVCVRALPWLLGPPPS